MSDEEDLLKLKKRYEKGEIPKSRYEEERAWILGTASLLMPGGDMEDEQGGDSDGTEAGHLKKTAEISSDDVSEAPVITVDDVCRMKPAAEEKKKEAKESDLDLKYAEDEAAILGKRTSCAAVSSGASSSGSFERTEPDRSFIRGTEEKDSGLKTRRTPRRIRQEPPVFFPERILQRNRRKGIRTGSRKSRRKRRERERPVSVFWLYSSLFFSGRLPYSTLQRRSHSRNG